MTATLRRLAHPAAPVFVVAVVVAAASTLVSGAGPTFYDDDPIAREVDTEDAAEVGRKGINLLWDSLVNMFSQPGDPVDRRAMSLNTIDEVLDSSWFTNRVGTRGLAPADVGRGPDTSDGPAPGTLLIVSGKSDGVTPGFTVRDATGQIWFVKFDPPAYPELATGAEVVATKLFWALGYHVPENHVATLRAEDLELTGESSIETRAGERALTRADIDRLLRQAARRPDGSYRVVASRALPGRPLGGFLYYGTRPDDPNDVIPHEHRRELRALRVFGAWLNHVDAKAINTMDTLVTENGRSFVRHHLLDFGSTLGSAAIKPREYDEGHEFLYEGGTMMKRLVTMGFYIRPWQTIPYPNHPSIGRFEGDHFDPEQWRPRTPNAGWTRGDRPDDTFWAARKVMAISDEMIAAAVASGQYSDPAAARYLAETLVKRRDRIGRAYLPKVNPLVAPALDRDGTLTFANAAVDAGVASAPEVYEAAWFHFDNATGEATPIGTPATARGPSLQAPPGLPTTVGEFVRVDVRATGTPHAAWGVPVHVYFRRVADGWRLVGLERLPETPDRDGAS